MEYRANPFKMLLSIDDHLYRIETAERVRNVWKVSGILVLLSMVIYVWMAYFGIGSELVTRGAVHADLVEYESSKLWFVVGRAIYGVILTAFVLFIPSLFYYLITEIPFQKLIIMQQVVFLVMLAERVIWIPIAIFAGLDWYVSPMSFGIIVSYLTSKSWIIYFFGAISLVQLWIIWFQIKYLSEWSTLTKRWLAFNVIAFHVVCWALVAFLSFMDRYMIGAWFE